MGELIINLRETSKNKQKNKPQNKEQQNRYLGQQFILSTSVTLKEVSIVLGRFPSASRTCHTEVTEMEPGETDVTADLGLGNGWDDGEVGVTWTCVDVWE